MKIKPFQHTLHKELYQWLLDNPGKKECDWPKWEMNGGDVKDATCWCFACDYERMSSSDKVDCDCPLDFPPGNKCGELNSLFFWFNHAGSMLDRMIYAMKIRDLPVREGVEWV